MKVNESQKKLYIVISQTGTLLSRIIRVVTGAEYNHASISVSADLRQMYSFGRVHPYNPVWGGFVTESPKSGTFKRFSNTKVIVLAVDISEERYLEICERLRRMWLQRRKYHYNYIGLVLAAFHIKRSKTNCYYCSEFVRDILLLGKIEGIEQLDAVVQPIHFLTLPHKKIYCGKLNEYEIEEFYGASLKQPELQNANSLLESCDA